VTIFPCARQLGCRRDAYVAYWDKCYGKGNWRIAWKVQGELWDFQAVITQYEEAYQQFLLANPGIFEWLQSEAAEVYDCLPSDMGIYCYRQQSNDHDHFHDIALRRSIRALGGRFRGDQPIQIRGHWSRPPVHPLAFLLSPGAVPLHRPDLMPERELPGWWRPGSVESFYLSSRVIQVTSS
jgi:hypothetical protein